MKKQQTYVSDISRNVKGIIKMLFVLIKDELNEMSFKQIIAAVLTIAASVGFYVVLPRLLLVLGGS